MKPGEMDLTVYEDEFGVSIEVYYYDGEAGSIVLPSEDYKKFLEQLPKEPIKRPDPPKDQSDAVLNSWISVKDRLPEKHKKVRVMVDPPESGFWETEAMLAYGGFVFRWEKDDQLYAEYITDWQPILEPTKN